jgi:CxxC motif-containing protein (DUF1111 family)
MNTGAFSITASQIKHSFLLPDLLLHDMGPGLDDSYTEGSALTSEWRTPALWGFRFISKFTGGQVFLMHDGRAKSIEQAISMHGGEAMQSKESFQQLTDNQKAQVVKFLKSL